MAPSVVILRPGRRRSSVRRAARRAAFPNARAGKARLTRGRRRT